MSLFNPQNSQKIGLKIVIIAEIITFALHEFTTVYSLIYS